MEDSGRRHLFEERILAWPLTRNWRQSSTMWSQETNIPLTSSKGVSASMYSADQNRQIGSTVVTEQWLQVFPTVKNTMHSVIVALPPRRKLNHFHDRVYSITVGRGLACARGHCDHSHTHCGLGVWLPRHEIHRRRPTPKMIELIRLLPS